LLVILIDWAKLTAIDV